jgi:hypothetical protein
MTGPGDRGGSARPAGAVFDPRAGHCLPSAETGAHEDARRTDVIPGSLFCASRFSGFSGLNAPGRVRR